MSKKDNTKAKTRVSQLEAEVHLDIPDDEIWTYKIEGLAAPHINKPFKNATAKKIALVLVIIVAVSLSMFFSIYSVVRSTGLEFSENETGYTLTRYSDTEKVPLAEIDVDYVFEVKDGKQVKNTDQVITEIAAFAFNESPVKVVNIGPGVQKIDNKAFYSCWSLERIEVDENNPYYSDIDGVLYNKDQTVLMNYPCNHDQYLRVKYGYDIPEDQKLDPEKDKAGREAQDKKYKEPFREENEEEYNKRFNDSEHTLKQYRIDIQSYVVPATVKVINEVAFSYTNLREIYLPEGLEEIGSCGFFKLHEPRDEWGNTDSLNNIYTYTADDYNGDGETKTRFTSKEALGEIYLSLPEGLTSIGSDAFSYNKELNYIFVPSSVTFIGHHAFYWDCAHKGENIVYTPLSESEFNEKVDAGDQWRPQCDTGLFKKSVVINYSAERQVMPEAK